MNINEVPGFRVENSPFGGIKDSGLGIKAGGIAAMKGYSYVKTFSLPWCPPRTSPFRLRKPAMETLI